MSRYRKKSVALKSNGRTQNKRQTSNQKILNRRDLFDQCLSALTETHDELRAIILLFEHLDNQKNEVAALAGLSVTFSRWGMGIAEAMRVLNEFY